MTGNLMGGNQMNGSPFDIVNQFLNCGGNPQNVMNFLMQRNPNTQQMMTQVKNLANGRSPQDVAMQLAKQKGIDPEQINAMVKRLSGK